MALFYRADGWVKQVSGQAVAGAQIYVCSQPASLTNPPTPLATIYSDANGVSPITQPIFTDGFGHYSFYAPSGFYTVVVVNAGQIQQVYTDQTVGVPGVAGGGTVTNTSDLAIGQVVTGDGGDGVQTSGTLLSSLATALSVSAETLRAETAEALLAPLAGAAFTGPVSVPSLNNVVYADRYPGGDVGAKLTAALAALPSAGGTIDARGFQGAQTWSSVFNINKSGVTLLLPPPLSANFTVTVNAAIALTAVTAVTITGGKLTLSGSSITAIVPVTSLDNFTLQGMEILGDGVAAHVQQGFYASSGVNYHNIKILNNTLLDLNLAVSINADLAGSIDGFLIEGNDIRGTVTTGGSDGYSIHHANGSGNPSNGRIINNYVSDPGGRHSIYQAKGRGVVISGNTLVNHRNSIQSGTQRPNISCGRSQDITISNNVLENPSDGGIDVWTNDASFPCNNVVVSGNVIRNPNSFFPITIGTSGPAGPGDTSNVTISGNTIVNDANVSSFSNALLYVYYCQQLTVIGNTFAGLNYSGTANLTLIVGQGEVGTATYSNNLLFRSNTLYATGGTVRGIRLESAICTSTSHMEFSSNRISVSGTSWSNAAFITDPNVYILDTPIDGLGNIPATVNQFLGAILSGATPTGALTGVGLGATTANSASDTGAIALPAHPAGFLEVNVGGTVYKLPFYAA